MSRLEKRVMFGGQPVLLRCDGRCDKAFGISGRPHRQLSDDPDDYVFLADDAVGVAPPPGETADLSEGEDLKPSAVPLTDPSRMNKWCARACERAGLNDEPPDMSRPKPNIPTGPAPKEHA